MILIQLQILHVEKPNKMMFKISQSYQHTVLEEMALACALQVIKIGPCQTKEGKQPSWMCNSVKQMLREVVTSLTLTTMTVWS